MALNGEELSVAEEEENNEDRVVQVNPESGAVHEEVLIDQELAVRMIIKVELLTHLMPIQYKGLTHNIENYSYIYLV